MEQDRDQSALWLWWTDRADRLVCQRFPGTSRWRFKQSGVNVVPITITNGVTEEEAALVAGVTGYAITEGEVTDGNVAFPAVQSVLGWGLFIDPNSKFD